MSSVCRVCLAGNTQLHSVKSTMLHTTYDKLTDTKFNSEDARPRALCSFCYQKLLRCHTFSQMAVRSEKIFNHVYDMGLEVTHEYITEVKLKMKKHLSVNTNVGSQVNIKDEPLPTDIDIKEEVTTEPDILLEVESFPKDCIKKQFTFKEDISDRENDTEELLSNLHTNQSKPDDSYFTIKDEPLSTIDIKEEITTELVNLVELGPFPKQSTKSQLTFEKDNRDQEIDVKELLKNQIEHTKQDHSKMPFSCHNCNKIFYLRSKLISHVRKSHPQVNGKQYSYKQLTVTTSMIEYKKKQNEVEKLVCDECDKSFVNKSNLIRHIKIHRGEKPFACNVCDKHFNRKCDLVCHIWTHTDEKPFACNVCSKKYTRKGSLVCHTRTHTGEKPFFCHVCEKRFSDNSTLTKHLRIHTGAKPFACHVCVKQFNRKDNLIAHMRTHTVRKHTKPASPRGGNAPRGLAGLSRPLLPNRS